MNSSLPQPQGAMLGPNEHVKLPPERSRKIRVQSLVVGTASLILGVFAGFIIVTAGLGLPTSKYASTVFFVGMGGIAAFFHLFSSITLISGRAAVHDDRLNVTLARKTRRLLTVLWVSVAVTTLFAIYAFTSLVHGSHVGYLPPIRAYLVVLCVPIALASLNSVTGRRVLRPADEMLQK